MGSLRVEPADLERDKTVLVQSLRDHLTPRSNLQRFDWLYEHNPDGRAQVIVLRDAMGRIVGSGAVIPRKLTDGKATATGSVMADFWVHPDHRALGAALQLQRACVAVAEKLGSCFWDLPQGAMPAVYRRMGILGGHALCGMVKPVDLSTFIRARVRPRMVAAPTAWIASRVLAMRDRLATGVGSFEVDEWHGTTGVEFDLLAQQTVPGDGWSVMRSAAYLNWRYLDHPHLRHRIFVARKAKQLVGYAILIETETHLDVVDLRAADTSGTALVAMLVSIAQECRKLGLAGVTTSLLANDARLEQLKRIGFSVRAQRAMVIHSATQADTAMSSNLVSHLQLCYGDIDY
jgi:GNAT superfamily N-acetyltransferase